MRCVAKFHSVVLGGAPVDELVLEAKLLGFELMPWQLGVFGAALEPGRFGQFAVTCPRQQGKSVLMLVLCSWWARSMAGQTVLFMSQDRIAASRRLYELEGWLLEAGVEFEARHAAGREDLRFPNGSEILIVSASERAGHGESADLVVLDECWALQPRVLQSLVPVMTAKPDSLMFVVSTMGTEDSEVLNGFVERGRAAVSVPDARLGYVEYSAPDGIDAFDSSNWSLWMPALEQNDAVTVEKIQTASDTFAGTPSEWLRAYGNVLTRSDSSVFPVEWVDRVMGKVGKPPSGLVVGVDVNRGMSSVSIAVGWLEDGVFVADLADFRLGGATGWVAGRVSELVERYGAAGVVISYGPAVVLKPELERVCESLGVEFHDLNTVASASAAMRLFDVLKERQISLGQVSELREAFLAARAKSVGDRWRFDRDVLVDQSPLVAVSCVVEVVWMLSQAPGWSGIY